MQNYHQHPKDIAECSMSKPTIRYHQTPEFKRWFAKYYFSGYLIMGIIIPLLWFFVFPMHIIELITILSLQIMCVSQMLYIFAYSIDEIRTFLLKKLGDEKNG